MHTSFHIILVSVFALYLPVAEATGGNLKLAPIIGASIIGIIAIGAFFFFSKRNQQLIKNETNGSDVSKNPSETQREVETTTSEPSAVERSHSGTESVASIKNRFEEMSHREEEIQEKNRLLEKEKALEELKRQEEEEEEEKKEQVDKAKELLRDRIRRHKEAKRVEEQQRQQALQDQEERAAQLQKQIQLEEERKKDLEAQLKALETEKERQKQTEIELQSTPVSDPETKDPETKDPEISKFESPNRLRRKAGSQINFSTSSESSPLHRRSPSFSDIPRPDLDKLAEEDFSDSSYQPEHRERERSFSESATAPPTVVFDAPISNAQPKGTFFPTTPLQCSACRKSIFGKPIETASGNKYHPRCFSCAKCQKKIAGKFFPYEHPSTVPAPQVEWYLCEYCFNSLKQPKPAFTKKNTQS